MFLTVILSVLPINANHISNSDYVLVGYVKDKWGNPVKGAKVTILDDLGQGTTDSNGYYEAGFLDYGDPRLFASHTVIVSKGLLRKQTYCNGFDFDEISNGFVWNNYTFNPWFKIKNINMFTRGSLLFNLLNYLDVLKTIRLLL